MANGVILAVCLNPALDITYTVDALQVGGSHRVERMRERAGGKGVNVARVLAQLDASVMITGFLGASVAEAFEADLAGTGEPPVAGGAGPEPGAAFRRVAGISSRFIRIREPTRRSVTVVDRGTATVFNEPGPIISSQEWEAFLESYAELASGAAVVVLSGSLPRGLPTSTYEQLIRCTDARTIIDCEGTPLVSALSAKPWLAKPNAVELAGITGRSLDDDSAIRAAAEDLRDRGAVSVVVSRGAGGLIAIDPDGTAHSVRVPPVAGNPTGAGDALTAAIAHGLELRLPWPALLADAAAVSAAAVAVDIAGEIDSNTYEHVRGLLNVEVLP